MNAVIGASAAAAAVGAQRGAVSLIRHPPFGWPVMHIESRLNKILSKSAVWPVGKCNIAAQMVLKSGGGQLNPLSESWVERRWSSSSQKMRRHAITDGQKGHLGLGCGHNPAGPACCFRSTDRLHPDRTRPHR